MTTTTSILVMERKKAAKNVNGKYYYFDPEMITNTHKLINGVLYYFDANGGNYFVNKLVHLNTFNKSNIFLICFWFAII